MTDILDVISSRHSVRNYNGKHIPDEDLRKVLEAGRLAPSWMNVQPWKFIVVQSQENKDLLSELSIGQPQVKNADALVVCVADTSAWKEAKITEIQNPALNPALQRSEGILIRTLEQIIYPTAYMMLEASALGIGVCIIGAVGSEITEILPNVYEKAKKQLNLNDNQIIAGIMTLGYEESPSNPQKVRKDFDEVVYSERIGDKF